MRSFLYLFLIGMLFGASPLWGGEKEKNPSSSEKALEIQWRKDIEKAFEEGQKQKKLVMAYFHSTL